MSGPWTDERVETLKVLWRRGMSAGLIADEMGMVRNAIIGKMHRLGLTGRASPDRRKRYPPRVKPRKRPREWLVKGESHDGHVVTLARGFSTKSEAEDHPVVMAEWSRVWVEPVAHASTSQSWAPKRLSREQSNAKAEEAKDALKRVTAAKPDEPPSFGLSLLKLRDAIDGQAGTCKWPHGDGQFTFCGHDAEVVGNPYCKYHRRLASGGFGYAA